MKKKRRFFFLKKIEVIIMICDVAFLFKLQKLQEFDTKWSEENRLVMISEIIRLRIYFPK